jgi:hypothetical protein
MNESDQLAASFITPLNMFYYVIMPFGFRNVGVTYHRCMQHVFGDHIRRTLEAYLDGIVVKTTEVDNLVNDLRAAFKPREVHLRGVARHAIGFYRLPTRNRAQPLEGLGTRSNGTNPTPESGAKGFGLPGGFESLHFAPRREGLTPILTPKKALKLFLNRRGLGRPRQTEGDPRTCADPHTASGWRASIPLCDSNHPGG